MGIVVKVSIFSGDTPDKWLLHELDKEFRTYYGIPNRGFFIRTIEGNTIYSLGIAGWDYRSISGNKVIYIEYHDVQMSKPEPMEVVKAYLAKHPSTLPTITMNELNSSANKSQWIKDEMDRRLWLCDRWFLQLQQGTRTQEDAAEKVTDSMIVLLNYREKYFKKYVPSKNKVEEEKMLISQWATQQSTTAIKSKFDEYKKWWGENKDRSISF